MKLKSHSSILGMTLTILAAVSVFAFFELLFPYTLRHKEQTMFLLLNDTWIDLHYRDLGLQKCIAVAGDWLMQLFYYPYIGALIVSVVLTTIGIVLYHAARRLHAPK